MEQINTNTKEGIMKLVEDVYELAENFMRNSVYVKLNEKRISQTASRMIDDQPSPFPRQHEVTDDATVCLLELIGGAINYCYWYGKSDVRPNGCRSSKMYKMVTEAMNYFEWDNFEECIEMLVQLLATNRFPMLEEREKHLVELVKFNAPDFAIKIASDNHKDCEPFFYELVSTYTGYASDMFLKRASLFFLQLYRKLGWYEDSISRLHVPADYQVPKVLEYFGCIEYSEGLKAMIDSHMPLPKHSVYECEIRAATVLACKKLMELTKWNLSDIDGWFWLGSKKVDGPFHLTITTDY